ncbi:helix-turn-helix domain-containing protein [Granulicella rosea]|uniref:helix-turn-helix domain-containing protein n=1 Tax=Granulicella rosea TaxID=474952 RepID=UPI001595B0F9|nr:helix-turn-helix domain-containing protein [Granulicella rosea]
MERFGEALRSEREQRGVTLEEICATTRVAMRHLENLEADQYGQLPGGVFRKGIARNYIHALGLEEGPWIERFEANLRSQGIGTETEGDLTQFAQNVKRSRGTTERGMGMRWLGVALLLALVGGGAWAAWKYVLHARVHF